MQRRRAAARIPVPASFRRRGASPWRWCAGRERPAWRRQPWSPTPNTATTGRSARCCIGCARPTRWGFRRRSRCSDGTPTLRVNRAQPPPRNRREGWPDQDPVSVRTLSDALPPRAWHRVAWRNGTHPAWEADFAARQKRTTSPERWSTADISPGLRLSFKRFSRACFSSVGPDTCTG